MLWDEMRLQGTSSQCCFSVNDGSKIDVDSHVVLVLWGGPGLLSVHVPISFHTPSFCLLPPCLLSTRSPHRVLTNDSTDFDYHFEVSLIPLLPISEPNYKPLSSFTACYKIAVCEGAGIHRFSDESPPQSFSAEMTINSILISVYFLRPNLLSLPRWNPLILSNSVTCWSGGWKVQYKCP